MVNLDDVKIYITNIKNTGDRTRFSSGSFIFEETKFNFKSMLHIKYCLFFLKKLSL